MGKSDGGRRLIKMGTSILKGYQIYHNYIRTHDGQDGKTTAQKCGIEIEDKNKWNTPIENAVSEKTKLVTSKEC